MKILLVRHGQSEANLPDYKQDYVDCTVPLTKLGAQQAVDAGKFIEAYLSAPELQNKKVRLWNSGYKRTRETTQNILKHAGSKITDIREDNRLREQDFGLFDGLSRDEQKKRYPEYHAHLDKFTGPSWYFAKFPMGESRADVEDRLYTYHGTLKRDEAKGIECVVIVTHGNTIRSLVKNMMHHPFEWVDKEPNPGNCNIRLVENDGKGYVDHGYIYTGKREEIDAMRKKAGLTK